MTDLTAITETAKVIAVQFPKMDLTADQIIDYAIEDAGITEYSLSEPECRKIVTAYRTACLDNERARRAELEAAGVDQRTQEEIGEYSQSRERALGDDDEY